MITNSKERRIEKVLQMIDENIDLTPEILMHIANREKKFQETCKKNNDWALREVAGDLMCILSQKRLPPQKVITKLLFRVKQTIFPNGLTKEGNFHQGERNFYEKYLKEYENENAK